MSTKNEEFRTRVARRLKEERIQFECSLLIYEVLIFHYSK